MNLLSNGALTGGKLFSFGFLLALAASWNALNAASAPGPADVTRALLTNPVEVDWRTLGGLDYRTGETTEELDALDGTVVKIAGFTVPFEDWAASATEFLLVPYAGAYVHTPPPPPHQLVYVTMAGSMRAALAGASPMWVEGVLHIEETDNIYGQAGFRLVGLKVYPYQN